VTDTQALDLTDALAPGSFGAPRPRPGLIDRDELVASLVGTDDHLVVVAAPAGFGKTTTMLLWDRADQRSFAWVNLDRLDDDPVHLARHLAVALEEVAPLDPVTWRKLTGAGRSPELELMPVIAAEVVRRGPLVLVIDDVHLVTNEMSLRCLERLIDATPRGSTVALVGRALPTVRLPRRRMEGRVRDIDASMLALSADEAQRLFEAMDVELSTPAIEDLVARTEGWAGGLHLAGMSISHRSGKDPDAKLTGRDRLVADYLVEEVLAALPDDVVAFLERSSVLDRMSAQLLDDLLQIHTSGAQLRALEESGNLFLVPLDGERQWFRYHHLFGELLRSRLRERDPRTFVELHGRASAILERAGDDDGAFEHAVAAGDIDRAMTIVMARAPQLVLGGRVGVLARWLDRLDERTLAGTATGSLARAWVGIGIGDVPLARYAATAALELGAGETLPDGVTTVPVAVACLRSVVAPDGLRGIIDDTNLAVREGDERMRPWWSLAISLRATALSMMGAIDEASRLFEAARPGLADLPAFAAGLEAHLALLALERDDLTAAAAHVRAARRFREHHDFEGLTAATIVFAADALVSARLGNRPEALREAAIARNLVARLDDVVPRTALIVHVTLARACLLIDDRAQANHHVQLADHARVSEPLAAKIGEQLDAVHVLLDAVNRASAGGPALTAAELRVLPYLATHLSLKEIAAELFISRNTAKSHAVAIYRKLDATSRSEAVARATELGLLQG
jgi:LuxR family maltose regulon positive regulatory protein